MIKLKHFSDQTAPDDNNFNEPPNELPNSDNSISILQTIGFIAAALVVAFAVQAFLFQSYEVDGQSMETTLQNGNRLIVNKTPRTIARITRHAYVPHRGQIIIFNQDGLSFGFNGNKQLIKRVIGLPGERVVVSQNVITVYNQAHPNGYNPDKSGLYSIAAKTTPGNVDVTLGNNEIFVCGDNRGNSEDSRYFGPVAVQNIVGQLSFRILPFNEVHRP